MRDWRDMMKAEWLTMIGVIMVSGGMIMEERQLELLGEGGSVWAVVLAAAIALFGNFLMLLGLNNLRR